MYIKINSKSLDFEIVVLGLWILREPEVTRTLPDTLAADAETPNSTFLLSIYHYYNIIYIIFQSHSVMNSNIILRVSLFISEYTLPLANFKSVDSEAKW